MKKNFIDEDSDFMEREAQCVVEFLLTDFNKGSNQYHKVFVKAEVDSDVDIKTENASYVNKTEEPLNVVHFQSRWDNKTLDPVDEEENTSRQTVFGQGETKANNAECAKMQS